MVQTEPILSITLKALAESGACLSAEVRNGVESSLAIKKSEVGLTHLYYWGKIATRNGKDYLIAEGHNGGHVFKGEVNLGLKHFVSQDGTTWADLPDISNEQKAVCEQIALKQTLFTGDSAAMIRADGSTPQEGDVAPPAPEPVEGEEPPALTEVSELVRLRYVVTEITTECGVVPYGVFIENAENKIIPNSSFNGIAYPGKLEYYQHFVMGPDTPKSDLGQAPRGSWSLRYDNFKGIAVGRSNVWLGYSFYYDNNTKLFGGVYNGDGNKNADLIFML
jgi:radial spoke head protein 9